MTRLFTNMKSWLLKGSVSNLAVEDISSKTDFAVADSTKIVVWDGSQKLVLAVNANLSSDKTEREPSSVHY